jgi:hypothetical protein
MRSSPAVLVRGGFDRRARSRLRRDRRYLPSSSRCACWRSLSRFRMEYTIAHTKTAAKPPTIPTKARTQMMRSMSGAVSGTMTYRPCAYRSTEMPMQIIPRPTAPKLMQKSAISALDTCRTGSGSPALDVVARLATGKYRTSQRQPSPKSRKNTPATTCGTRDTPSRGEQRHAQKL